MSEFNYNRATLVQRQDRLLKVKKESEGNIFKLFKLLRDNPAIKTSYMIDAEEINIIIYCAMKRIEAQIVKNKKKSFR